MDVTISVPDWQVKFEQQVKDGIMAEIARALADKIDIDKVAYAVIDQINTYLCYGTEGMGEGSAVIKMLDKRLGDLITNISDEELKNVILERLMAKL
jgi:hypothetical protein